MSLRSFAVSVLKSDPLQSCLPGIRRAIRCSECVDDCVDSSDNLLDLCLVTVLVAVSSLDPLRMLLSFLLPVVQMALETSIEE